MPNNATNMPIIKHCKNCQWCKGYFTMSDNVYCKVTYKPVSNFMQRIRALSCKYYKAKEQDNA